MIVTETVEWNPNRDFGVNLGLVLARSNQLQKLESSQPIIDEPKLLVNDIKWTALQIEYLHSQGIRIADKECFISKFHNSGESATYQYWECHPVERECHRLCTN